MGKASLEKEIRDMYKPAIKAAGLNIKIKSNTKKINKISKLVKSEPKFFDTLITNNDVNYTGALYDLTVVPQTSTTVTASDETRDGSVISPTSLELKYVCQFGAAAGQARLILLRDKWGTGTPPTPAEVLEFVGTNLAPICPFEFGNRKAKRFQILKDVLNVGDQYNTIKAGKLNCRLKHPVKFLGQSGSAESTNHIYLYMFSSLASGNGSNPFCSFHARLNFLDV